MFSRWFLGLCLCFVWNFTSCSSPVVSSDVSSIPLPGAYDIDSYLPILENKAVGLVANHTSFVGERHLLDTLLSLGVKVESIFSPEHGFRGEASDGEKIRDDIDLSTDVRIQSIYGRNKKPTKEQLDGIDVIIFDIQDVGARFYTFISTLEYVMEACAEHDIPVIVLDRPNPNGHYVDGPVLDLKNQSFVGRQAIPIVHGMTVGEYAQLLNGEGWLAGGLRCDLIVIPCQNYTHDSEYTLPIKPSPNLPNQRAIYLYPSLCLLEGTVASLGRGTNQQFQIIIHPEYPDTSFGVRPVSKPGAKYPKHQNEVCYGIDLSATIVDELRQYKKLNLNYLLDFYSSMELGNEFFLENGYFEKLAGIDQLRLDILANKSEKEIRASWASEIGAFLDIRKKYLLYPDSAEIYVQ